MNFSAPARRSRISRYRSISAQRFRRAGSAWPRLAFCAKLVFGRLMVFFSSSVVVCVDISVDSKLGILIFRGLKLKVPSPKPDLGLWLAARGLRRSADEHLFLAVGLIDLLRAWGG